MNLEFKDIVCTVEDKVILDSVSFSVSEGSIQALLGPNGAGKSSICKVLMNHPSYTVKQGDILVDGKSVLELSTTERARMGIFLFNQSPIAIEGVSNAEMLRYSLLEMGKKDLDIFAFQKKLGEVCKKLDLPLSFVHRSINDGMSGGERKKNEMLHLWMLEPKLILLDEIDSGLDVDALKIVTKSLKEYYEEYHPTILIITHQDKLIKALHPSTVHIIKNGKIMDTGDYELAIQTLNQGFSGTNPLSQGEKNE